MRARACARLASLAALVAALALGWSGQALAAQRHWVRWGDSLWRIARQYGTTVEAIRQANGLQGDLIYAGEVLTIPDGAPAWTGAAAAGAAGAGGVAASPWEVDLLARLITAEAGGEPYAGQVAVGAVVLNRVRSPLFPSTIAGVIYEPYQFEPVLNGWIDRPATATARQAALDALGGWDPTGGALYFFNWRTVTNPFLWSLTWKATIGGHRFVG